MIEIRRLRKYFGELHVLKGIDLDVQKGEVLSIIGASGSGKSTLLYCINGLEPIAEGTVVVDGVDVHAKGTDLNKLRRNLGMVFQQWNSFPHLTALTPEGGTEYRVNHMAEIEVEAAMMALNRVLSDRPARRD